MQSVFSVVCSLRGLVAIHPWVALGEQYWGTTFPGEYARQLMVQALFLLSGSSAPLPLHPGKECTVPQLPVPSSPDHSHICALCLSVLHLMARYLATREGLGCPQLGT